jgi:uncharacterized protein YukE
MNEFEEKDFGEARNLANAIKGNGDKILDIFNEIDNIMNSLYGNNWESAGADVSRSDYENIRKNYEAFYNKILTMRTHIYNVTAANENADNAARNIVTGI